jgi:hypothetical protein
VSITKISNITAVFNVRHFVYSYFAHDYQNNSYSMKLFCYLGGVCFISTCLYYIVSFQKVEGVRKKLYFIPY